MPIPTLESIERKLDAVIDQNDTAAITKRWIIAHIWIAAIMVLIGFLFFRL